MTFLLYGIMITTCQEIYHDVQVHGFGAVHTTLSFHIRIFASTTVHCSHFLISRVWTNPSFCRTLLKDNYLISSWGAGLMAPSGGHSDIGYTWDRLREVTEEASFNLKEAMKMLQELDSGDVFGHNQGMRRKMCGKKAMSRVDRALRQLAQHNNHMEELKFRMHVMQEKLNISQGTQKEVLQRMDAVASEMQEAVRRLQEEEDEKHGMVRALESAKRAADEAQHSLTDSLQKLQQKEVEQRKFLEDIECLKVQNEKLQKVTEEKRIFEVDEESKMKLCTQVERYKEVVARVTADNMVFLMKLRHSEDALHKTKQRQRRLEKEIENSRGRWLAEASAEIEDAVKGTLSKAEVCETELERLQWEEGKIVNEWQIKLQDANKRLENMTATRDWLEEAIVHTRERIKTLEEEKFHLQERLNDELQQQQNAQGDAQALTQTLRETTKQVNVVKDQYSGALKEIEAISNALRTKDHEVEQLLAALETANLQLETQQNVNTAIMRKKEEIEWQLLEVEALRNKL